MSQKIINKIFEIAEKQITETTKKLNEIEQKPEVILTELYNQNDKSGHFALPYRIIEIVSDSEQLGFSYLDLQQYFYSQLKEYFYEIDIYSKLEIQRPNNYPSNFVILVQNRPVVVFNIMSHKYNIVKSSNEEHLDEEIERIEKLISEKEALLELEDNNKVNTSTTTEEDMKSNSSFGFFKKKPESIHNSMNTINEEDVLVIKNELIDLNEKLSDLQGVKSKNSENNAFLDEKVELWAKKFKEWKYEEAKYL